MASNNSAFASGRDQKSDVRRRNVEATKAYILAFEEELGRAKNAGELEKAMTARYPQRWNRFLLERSCESSVQASKKS